MDIVDLWYYELTKDLETCWDSKYVRPLYTLMEKRLITDPDVIITGIWVELKAILEPGDLGSGVTPGNAHEADLPTEVVALHEVGGLDDASALKICFSTPLSFFFLIFLKFVQILMLDAGLWG